MDIPTIQTMSKLQRAASVAQVQKGLVISLILEDYCEDSNEPIYVKQTEENSVSYYYNFLCF